MIAETQPVRFNNACVSLSLARANLPRARGKMMVSPERDNSPKFPLLSPFFFFRRLSPSPSSLESRPFISPPSLPPPTPPVPAPFPPSSRSLSLSLPLTARLSFLVCFCRRTWRTSRGFAGLKRAASTGSLDPALFAWPQRSISAEGGGHHFDVTSARHRIAQQLFAVCFRWLPRAPIEGTTPLRRGTARSAVSKTSVAEDGVSVRHPSHGLSLSLSLCAGCRTKRGCGAASCRWNRGKCAQDIREPRHRRAREAPEARGLLLDENHSTSNPREDARRGCSRGRRSPGYLANDEGNKSAASEIRTRTSLSSVARSILREGRDPSSVQYHLLTQHPAAFMRLVWIIGMWRVRFPQRGTLLLKLISSDKSSPETRFSLHEVVFFPFPPRSTRCISSLRLLPSSGVRDRGHPANRDINYVVARPSARHNFTAQLAT